MRLGLRGRRVLYDILLSGEKSKHSIFGKYWGLDVDPRSETRQGIAIRSLSPVFEKGKGYFAR